VTHFTVRRQLERERREWVARAEERSRLDRERLTWAELTARAERQRAHDMLVARQQWNYHANLQKLFALAAKI
jgi:hypothetical protein